MLGDDRGQSIQIGAILLFGILVIGLAVVQTVVVPTENEQVEFNGYLETSEDLVTLRNDILTAGTQGGEQAEMVKTGVRYPSRAVLINPGPPVGSLRTNDSENVTISGATLVSGEEANARGYWNDTPHDYPTKTVRFSPAYNNIDVPPIEVSSTGAYRTTDNGPITLAGGTFISGNRITVVTVDGNLSTSSLTTSVGVTPKSVATRSVTLENAGSTQLNLTVPVPGNGTQAAAEAWNGSSTARSLRQSDSVNATFVNGSRVDVVLDRRQTYELRLANVVVHDAGDSGIDTDVEPQYLVPLDANGTEVPTNGPKRLSVEVRDEFNNPVEGATVEFSATNGTLDSGSTVTTGSEGRASVQFDIDDDATTANLSAAIDGEGVSPYNETTIQLGRAGAGAEDGGEDRNDINPNAIDGLVLRDAMTSDADCSNNVNCQVDFTLDNLDQNNSKNITELRFAFYSVDRQSSGKGSARDAPDQLELVSSGESLTIRGVYKSVGITVDKDQMKTISVRFEKQNGNEFDEVKQGDFFVLTALIDNDGDGTADESANYFIAPENP